MKFCRNLDIGFRFFHTNSVFRAIFGKEKNSKRSIHDFQKESKNPELGQLAFSQLDLTCPSSSSYLESGNFLLTCVVAGEFLGRPSFGDRPNWKKNVNEIKAFNCRIPTVTFTSKCSIRRWISRHVDLQNKKPLCLPYKASTLKCTSRKIKEKLCFAGKV